MILHIHDMSSGFSMKNWSVRDQSQGKHSNSEPTEHPYCCLMVNILTRANWGSLKSNMYTITPYYDTDSHESIHHWYAKSLVLTNRDISRQSAILLTVCYGNKLYAFRHLRQKMKLIR